MSVMEIIHVNTTASTLLVAMSVPVKWAIYYRTMKSTAQVCTAIRVHFPVENLS